MKWAVYDLETDGLLGGVTQVFCLVIQDYLGRVLKYSDDPRFGPQIVGPIRDGIHQLEEYEWLVGHNILGYDHRVLQKLYGWKQRKGQRNWDTIVGSRMIWPDIAWRDSLQVRKDPDFPGKWRGKHSLGSWGYRLANAKTEFDVVGMTELTQECLDYCVQDVAVNVDLFHLQMKRLEGDFRSIEIEGEFSVIIDDMQNRGWPFNEHKATELADTLTQELVKMDAEIQKLWPPYEKETHYVTPKKKLKRTKIETITFNPGSSRQVAQKLMGLGWKPTDFTKSGQVKTTRDILEDLPYPEATLLVKRGIAAMLLTKVEGGNKSWLKSLKDDGRIYGRVFHMGTRTSRCAHRAPNLGNIPKPGKPYGEECRDLFTARPGWVMVGADASAIDLRSLAHYMGDDEFTAALNDGDLHSLLAEAWGVDRSTGKNLTYALLYGAQDPKLGTMLGGGAAKGKAARGRLMGRFPKLAGLTKWAQSLRQFKGLDGRPVPNPSKHAALNTLAQTTSSIFMKVATILTVQMAEEAGLIMDVDWALLGLVHDELQSECRPEVAEQLGKIKSRAMLLAGETLGFKIPTPGDYLVGKTWRETH